MHEKLSQFIVDMFMYGDGELSSDQSLFKDGVIDSLGFTKLLAFVEDEFDLELDMSDVTMESFDTIDDIVGMIRAKQNS